MVNKTPLERFYYSFFKSKKKTLYFNQLKELGKICDSVLSKIVKDLKSKNLIKIRKEKNNTFYSIKNNNQTLRMFWQFATEKFDNLNPDVRMPLQNLILKEPTTTLFIILFGSSSRKEETKESDIDLLVVIYDFKTLFGKDYEKFMKKEFKKLEEKINSLSIYPINIKICSLDEFKKGEDRLIVEAKNTGFPITGDWLYYNTILEEW
jgi:hypothetical protein